MAGAAACLTHDPLVFFEKQRDRAWHRPCSLRAPRRCEMEMFLMALCMSLLGVAATAVAFAAATRDEPRGTDGVTEPKPVPDAAPPRFFVERAPVAAPPPRVPIEALLLQIERHIRLEQAAAESFLECPTAESLYTRTSSPLVH
jgi:hypothetical protein